MKPKVWPLQYSTDCIIVILKIIFRIYVESDKLNGEGSIHIMKYMT